MSPRISHITFPKVGQDGLAPPFFSKRRYSIDCDEKWRNFDMATKIVQDTVIIIGVFSWHVDNYCIEISSQWKMKTEIIMMFQIFSDKQQFLPVFRPLFTNSACFFQEICYIRIYSNLKLRNYSKFSLLKKSPLFPTGDYIHTYSLILFPLFKISTWIRFPWTNLQYQLF